MIYRKNGSFRRVLTFAGGTCDEIRTRENLNVMNNKTRVYSRLHPLNDEIERVEFLADEVLCDENFHFYGMCKDNVTVYIHVIITLATCFLATS